MDAGRDASTMNDRRGLRDVSSLPDVGGEPDVGLTEEVGVPPCGPAPEPGSVLHVDANAEPGGDGASWGTAHRRLQDALLNASSGMEVWVAAGTYVPVVPADPDNITNQERDASFWIPAGVSVFGGFTATEELACERDPGQHVTVLSGDLLANDSDEDGDGYDDAGFDDNVVHVVEVRDVDESAVLAGFTITGGHAVGSGDRPRGGGVFCENGSLELDRVVFEQNRAASIFGSGAAIAAFECSLDVRDSTFRENTSAARAGALHVVGPSTLEIRESNFAGNRAVSAGGALDINGEVQAMIRDSRFVGNEVTEGGGGNGNGGGVNVDGGRVIFSRVRFDGNLAEVVGGGLSVRSGRVIVSHSVFTDNDGGGRGGAIYNASFTSDFTATYSLLVGNRAGRGGAIASRGELRLDHSTVVGNEAVVRGNGTGIGGALYVIDFEGPIRVHSSIIWDNTAESGAAGLSARSSLVSMSVVQGTGGSPWPFPESARGDDGGGVIDEDPQFVDPMDPDGPDDVWGTADDGLALAPTSPAVDRGTIADVADFDQDLDRRSLASDLGDADADGDVTDDLSVDLTGAPRLAGRKPDIGAYERPSAVVLPSVIHVNEAVVGGAKDGSSWADAFDDLAEGLASALPGDEVWVAAGTYAPGDLAEDTFRPDNGVQLYGGFTGTETQRGQRDPDPETNGTVLTGDIGVEGVLSDNVQHVVVLSGLGPDAVLDGFTVTRGYDVQGGGRGDGGGIYIFSGAPTIRNVHVVENRASNGAGVFVRGSAEPSFRRMEFVDNDGWIGGAAHVHGSAAHFTDVYFTDNEGGGGGGGIAVLQSGRAFVSHCVFFENAADQSLSSPGPVGGGILAQTFSDVAVSQSVFVGNEAALGGGVGAFNTSTLRIAHSTFFENKAAFGGGIAVWNNSDGRIVSSILFGNQLSTIRQNPEAKELHVQGSGAEAFIRSNVIEDGPDGEGVSICATCTLDNDASGFAVAPGFLDPADPDGLDDRFATGDDGLSLAVGAFVENRGTMMDQADVDGDGNVFESLPDFGDIDEDGDVSEAVPSDITKNLRIVGPSTDIGAYERP